MSLFTNSEAKECQMLRCDYKEDYWVIGVIDNNNLYYEVKLNGLTKNATKNEIQSNTIAALEKKRKRTKNTIEVLSKDVSDNIGIGSSLG